MDRCGHIANGNSRYKETRLTIDDHRKLYIGGRRRKRSRRFWRGARLETFAGGALALGVDGRRPVLKRESERARGITAAHVREQFPRAPPRRPLLLRGRPHEKSGPVNDRRTLQSVEWANSTSPSTK